jgi:nitrogen fixation protein FixH
MTDIATPQNKTNIIPYIIVVVFVCFGIFIGQFVYRSGGVNNNLVSKDYYQKEIQFENRLQKQRNTVAIQKELSVAYKNQNLEINFPKDWTKASGEIHLYNMSDDKLDVKLPFEVESNHLTYSLKDLKPGNWTVKLDFTDGTTEYYLEQKLLF